METLLTTSPETAAAFLREGEAVAFPTETVYGLGADALRTDAVHKIFAAKGRPADNPLIVHLGDRSQLDGVVASVPPAARLLLDRFFPGPLTLILPRRETVPAIVSGGLETVGVRMPRHPVARAFLRACGGPVAAPSANRSGHPSPTTWQAVHADLNGRIACILQGDRSEVGLESTVVDATDDVPVVLRSGAIPLEALRAVVPGLRAADPARQHRSPGTRYRHYAPRARVRLTDHPDAVPAGPGTAYIGLTPPRPGFGLAHPCASVEAYAYALFDFFRRCDAAGIETIYCQRVPEAGLGHALMDRIERAARG